MATAAVRYRVKDTKLYVQPVAAGKPRRVALAPSGYGYDAASTSPRLQRWAYSNAGPNTLLSGALPALQGRSHDAVRRFGLADTAIDILTAHMVGTGIKPIWDTGDKALNAEYKAAFAEWQLKADADGMSDLNGMQSLAVRSMFIAGDVFPRFRARLPEDNLPIPLQIQLIESDYCPTSMTQMNSNGRVIINGIEFDAIRRRTAYWMYRAHPSDDPFGQQGEPGPIPASEIMHLSTGPLKRAGMIRGEPWLTRALVKLLDIDEWDDAHLKRQALAQLFGGWVTPAAEGLFNYADVTGQPTDDNPWIERGGTATAYMDAGAINVLRPGEEITFPNPPSPGDQYEAFSRQQLRFAAGAVGLLYEQLSGDYTGLNDRTWRSAIGEFKIRLARWQRQTIIHAMMQPIVERFVLVCDLSGRVKLPRPITPDRASLVKWGVPVEPYINPVQDVAARREEIRSGFTSREQDAAEHGEDVEAIDEANARDQEREARLKLQYDSNAKWSNRSGGIQVVPPGSAVPADPEAATQAALTAQVAAAQAALDEFMLTRRPPNA